jgi:uncharacterized protein (DUF302 family)
MKVYGATILQVKPAPKDAINLLEKALAQNGVTIYTRIDQQEETRKAGIKTLPIEYLLFGNPVKGGAVMQLSPLAALDLPLKVLAYQDEKLNNYIVFNKASFIAERYGLSNAAVSQIDIAPLISKLFS